MFSITNDTLEVIEWDSETHSRCDPYDYLLDDTQAWYCESGHYLGYVDFYVGV